MFADPLSISEQRFLGVDVGQVRVGVSLSDASATFAQPLEVIQRRKVCPFARLQTLCEQWQVTTLVLGLPLRLSGEEGPAVASVRLFAQKLQTFCCQPIVFWDERMTTVCAERAMISAGLRREDRRQTIDRVAAAVMLQSYLDALRSEASSQQKIFNEGSWTEENRDDYR